MILALLLCLQAPTLTTTEAATFQGGSFELFGQDFGLRGFSGLVYRLLDFGSGGILGFPPIG